MKKDHSLNFFKRPIGILLLIGLIVRVVLFFMYQPYNHIDEVIFSDGEGYHQLALNIINNGKFIAPNSFLDTIRTPIYPLFLALFYSIFGIKISVVILFQQILCLASVFLLYKIGKILFNKKVALFSATILCFEPNHIYFSFDLLTEALFVFLLTWGTFFFIHFIKENNLKFLVISTLIMGIATLTRPILLFIPAIGIFIITSCAFRLS